MEDFAAMLGEIFNRCEVQGMQLPFVVCAAAPNGSVLAMRHLGAGKDPDMLAEHSEDGMFRLPITIVVLDQCNIAVRITVAADGKRTWH
jgi:hypothetical protein